MPALALVGCSSAQPAKAPDSSPAVVVSESPKPKAKKPEVVNPKKTENPNALVEKQIVDFVDTRADVHGATVTSTDKEIIKSFHAYCDAGKAIKISKSKDLNENMDFIADKEICARLK